MNMLSGKGLILSTSLLLCGFASAAAHNANHPQNAKQFSYTANGKTDVKTAKLFKQLLKNSQHLQVTTQIKTHAPKPQLDVNMTYTITGTTSMKNVRKLMQLFKTSKQIQVTARANIKSNKIVHQQTFSFNQAGTWTIQQNHHRVNNYNGQLAIATN